MQAKKNLNQKACWRPRRADIPVCWFTGLFCPVWQITRADRPPELATGKSPAPADRNIRATVAGSLPRIPTAREGGRK